MVKKMLRKWLLSEEEKQERPCNQVGHDWTEWSESVLGPYGHTAAFGNRIRVEQKMERTCKKCGDVQFKNRTVGKVRITDDGGLEVIGR